MKKLKQKWVSLNLIFLVTASSVAFSGCKKELNLSDPGNLVPKTVDQDPSLPSIHVNNTMLHSEAFGNPDDPMVVILHGGPGVDYRSMLNCQYLANDGYYVVFFDQRGSGLSERYEKETYSIQLLQDDLAAVIQYYRRSPLQKVFLLGHSWGAMLATAYIDADPTAINGVILAEPGGLTWEQTKQWLDNSRPIKPGSEQTSDALYPDQFITGKENEQEILDYKFALTAAYDVAPGNVIGNAGPIPFWRYGAVVQSSLFELADRDGFDWTTHLNQFQTKVLFLYSELNTAYGYDYAKSVSSPFPSVQLEQINGCGHEMFYFGWDNCHPIILNYLNALK